MKRFVCNTIFIFFIGTSLFSQSKFDDFFKPSDTLNIPRRNAVVITESALAGVTLIGLNQLWYRDFERGKFHTVNDNGDWLQLDKLGHVYSAYHLGRFGANILNWSGVSKKNQLLYGATLGFGFLTTVEVFDGFSEEWGFSWGDMIANAAGTGLYVGQELLWNEQRISIKYSFHQTRYAKQNPEKLGNGFLEEVLKDYNGQTYWLSFNVHSFFKDSNIPKWIDVAIGYGGDGLLTGSKDFIVNNTLIKQNQQRQFYLSLDVNLTKIKTKSHFLRSLFDVFSSIKVPFPTVEFNDKNGVILRGIYF